MRLHTMKRVTIVAALSHKNEILAMLDEAGVHHYTFFEVFGKGDHTAHHETESRNIRVESIVSSHLMDELIETLHREMLGEKALIVYVQDVEVMRHQKFL